MECLQGACFRNLESRAGLYEQNNRRARQAFKYLSHPPCKHTCKEDLGKSGPLRLCLRLEIFGRT